MRQEYISKSMRIAPIILLIVIFSLVTFPSTINSQPILSSRSNFQDTAQINLEFNGTRAFTYLEDQCDFGPRPPGSNNLTACGDYIITSLENQGWLVQTQSWLYRNTLLRNILAGAIDSPSYVLLAHYDTRPIADMDPAPLNRSQPILGANDGASGVAILLELAAVLPQAVREVTTLLFVDAEDSGNYNGWEWIIGSTYYVNSLSNIQKSNIQAAILLDMVGDANLQLRREQYSTPKLVNTIWQLASDLNYENVFLNVSGFAMLDDHRPFLDAGIPAIDIIDFEYPYWHTLADSPDKCSSSSLEIVGLVVEHFMESQLINPTRFRPNEPTISLPIPPIWLMTIPIIFLGIIGILIFRRRAQTQAI